MAHQQNQTSIQYHSRWFTSENSGLKISWKYKQYTKNRPGKTNNKNKTAWFSHLLRHTARKWGGLILQCFRVHKGEGSQYH